MNTQETRKAIRGDFVRLNAWSARAEVVGVFGEFLWLKFRDKEEPVTRLAADYQPD